MPPIRNVSRHLTTTSTGWLVRMRSIGKMTRRYFSDHRYGGKQKAMQAAIRFRDGLLKTYTDGRCKLGNGPSFH